jgi:7,8-dihydroneopterin aldolase/epimerase/oxygenase
LNVERPTDTIFLEGIDVYAFGGVSESEREVGQRYRLDISLELDLRRAGVTDSLADSVSYARAYEIATGIMQSRTFNLVESQAEAIASAILEETRADAVMIRLRKLMPPLPGAVAAAGVEIRRTRA